MYKNNFIYLYCCILCDSLFNANGKIGSTEKNAIEFKKKLKVKLVKRILYTV